MSKCVYIVAVGTFSTSCPRQAHKNQIFPFFIRQILCFKGLLSPEVSKNPNGVGDWVGEAVAWMHKNLLCPRNKSLKRC